MKITAQERKATKEVFDLLEDAGLSDKEAESKIAAKYKMSEKRLHEVVDYVDASRLFVDNGTTMVKR